MGNNFIAILETQLKCEVLWTCQETLVLAVFVKLVV